MKCKKIEKWLSDGLDGELSKKKDILLRGHLEECSECRLYLQNLERIQEETGKLETPDLSPAYWKEFTSRLEEKLLDIPPEKRPVPLLSSWRKWAWVGASLFVGIAASVIFFMFRGGEAPDVYTFTFEDSVSRLYQQIGDNQDLEQYFNVLLLNSIEEDCGTSGLEHRPNFYNDPLLWENITEEEMNYLASEIKKEIKS